jgi:tetratricopeptide (TPR) repeat protein
VDEKNKAEAVVGQQTTDVPKPADPAASADITAALDPSTDAEGVSAGQPPRSEPEATEADMPAAVPDKGLPFLQPATRPGSLGRLGHFEVLEVLGKGGFGIVLKALDDKLQRVVAIKVLGPLFAGNATARSRFVREARAAARVRSKHVVSTYEVEEQPIPYLVMEYVAGKTLQDHIDQQGTFAPRDVIRIGAEIAEGLAAAHQQGLIHRDIKPANILLAACGLAPNARPQAASVIVKIADFGLARAADDASLTQSGVIAGTPMFMSPEQARGEALDHRSDLFSLGSVLYTMCAGQPPFRASKTLGILKRVCDDAPQPIRQVNAAVPQALVAVVNKLLAKDPAGRFQSAEAVADALRKHLDDLPLSPPGDLAGRATTDHSRRYKARPRRLALVLGLAVACALLVAVGGVLLFLLPPRPTVQGGPGANPSTGIEQPPVAENDAAKDAREQIQQAAVGASARGLENCRRGEWAKAAKESLAEIAAYPDERVLWATAAARLLLAGDQDGYRQLYGRMIEQFRNTTRPEQADSLCKVCLFLPNTVDRSRLPSNVLADSVEQGTVPDNYRSWFCAGLALVAYRDGQFEQANRYAEKSHEITKRRGQPAALALLAQAMAQHQLRQADQARKSLAEGTALVPYDLATLGSPDFQGALPVGPDVVGADWLIAEIIRREAALLILKDARRSLDAQALRERGLALFNQGKFDDALTAFRLALEQEERHGWTHHLVGVILVRKQKADDAIPEFRRAIEVAPDYGPPYASLGIVLAKQSKADEAVTLLDDAVKKAPQYAPVHRILGELLLHQGKVDEAATRLGKALELNPQDGMALHLRAEAMRLQALLPKLDQLVDGTAEPADNEQRLDLARLCSYRHRFAGAARFYAAALDADPKLADDAKLADRYNAACAAARAGHGDGDGARLGAAERACLRKQAVAWLRADLDAVTKWLAADKVAERQIQLARLSQWKTDTDLASLRDADQVGKLPEDERESLKALWSDLDAALKGNP